MHPALRASVLFRDAPMLLWSCVDTLFLFLGFVLFIFPRQYTFLLSSVRDNCCLLTALHTTRCSVGPVEMFLATIATTYDSSPDDSDLLILWWYDHDTDLTCWGRLDCRLGWPGGCYLLGNVHNALQFFFFFLFYFYSFVASPLVTIFDSQHG